MKLLDGLVRQPQALLTPASFGFDGNQYPLFSSQGAPPEIPDSTFLGYIAGIHERNGVVAAAVEARALLMSGLRFEWERENGDRFSNLATRRLNRPGSTTRPAFLKTLEYDVSYSGSAYVVNDGAKKRRLRPDRCSVVLGSESDPQWDGNSILQVPYDAEVAGLVYHPGSGPSQLFFPGSFTIYAPEPDSINFWRGTSWVTSVLREIVTDGQATTHTQKFFENGTVPDLAFVFDPKTTTEQIKEYKKLNEARHAGAFNAYKSLYLGGGVDVKPVGADLESLNLKDLTGGLENRVAVRSRIPAVILGIREGLSGSSLNAGNYASARRLLADGWFTPTAELLCAALETLVTVPDGTELVPDTSKVLFLQEDRKDDAEILQMKAGAARTLADGGWDPDSVTSMLGLDGLEHSGKLSVQLQPPGEGMTSDEA